MLNKCKLLQPSGIQHSVSLAHALASTKQTELEYSRKRMEFFAEAFTVRTMKDAKSTETQTQCKGAMNWRRKAAIERKSFENFYSDTRISIYQTLAHVIFV